MSAYAMVQWTIENMCAFHIRQDSTPVCPLHTPETLPKPQQHHTESQVISELVSIVKTTSDALQNIVWIAIRQVNAERQLAHKPK
jgi:hypothetical protein